MESVERTPSVSEVVSRAAALCDPDGHDDSVAALVKRFEDDDRPGTAVSNLAELLTGSLGEEGPQLIGPAAKMTAVVAAWLTTNFAEADDAERVLREASRAAFAGRPPPDMSEWLESRAVAI